MRKNKYKKWAGTVYSSTCTAVFDSVQCLYTKYSAIQRYEIHTALVARTLFCILVRKGTLLHGLTSV